jgi:L-fuculokinase
MTSLVAVLDIGKTNTKLMLVEAPSGRTVWSAERASAAIPSRNAPVLNTELDIFGIENWLLAQLRDLPERERVSAILPIAHGAALVLVDGEGEVLAAPDYEDTSFDRLRAEYTRLRDPFAQTLSPALPAGLNLGTQLYHLQNEASTLFLRARYVLTYPQYWSWRLSGVAASEVTSLGCHSDLWNPAAATFSDLLLRQGWSALMPPLQPARAVLGPLRQEIAEATGLPKDCGVICGIHDSNASYLAHRVARPDGDAFTVVSSGTWCIVLAKGADLTRLRESDDMLANVDALGEPTATARFMGGREYAVIAGEAARGVPPTEAGLAAVLAEGAQALPSFALGGPFQGRTGRLEGAEALKPPASAALATLYCALMADLILDRLGTTGAILVDGPFAENPIFGRLLQALRPTDFVSLSGTRNSIAAAVLWLAGRPVSPEVPATALPPLPMAEALRIQRDRWRALIA